MDLSKIANIGNLSLVQVAMNTLTNRAEGLPGLGVLYGASGYGKTTATIVFANKTQANYMRLSSVLSKKTFLEKITFEIGANPSTKNTSGYFDAICEQLAITNRPLILDEADYLVSKTGMYKICVFYGQISPRLILTRCFNNEFFGGGLVNQIRG